MFSFSVVASISVLWYCWLGLLTCKNRLPYNLYCVGGDVKHCSLTHSLTQMKFGWSQLSCRIVSICSICLWCSYLDCICVFAVYGATGFSGRYFRVHQSANTRFYSSSSSCRSDAQKSREKVCSGEETDVQGNHRYDVGTSWNWYCVLQMWKNECILACLTAGIHDGVYFQMYDIHTSLLMGAVQLCSNGGQVILLDHCIDLHVMSEGWPLTWKCGKAGEVREFKSGRGEKQKSREMCSCMWSVIASIVLDTKYCKKGVLY